MASRGDADVPGIEVIGVISDILPNFARFQASTFFYLFRYTVFIKCQFIQVLQPTVFHDRDFFTFASPLPTVKPRFLALIRPFETVVWVMTAVTVITLGIILFFISNIEVIESNN